MKSEIIILILTNITTAVLWYRIGWIDGKDDLIRRQRLIRKEAQKHGN